MGCLTIPSAGEKYLLFVFRTMPDHLLGGIGGGPGGAPPPPGGVGPLLRGIPGGGGGIPVAVPKLIPPGPTLRLLR